MSKENNVWVVIPAYNCESTVAGLVSNVRRRGFPVLVVDDGSQDRTASLAREAGARVLQHARNRGKGCALITGFLSALENGAESIVTMDADGQHDPADIPALLSNGDFSEMVIGQRQISINPMPPASFIGNCVSTFFISLFCGRHFPDTQCGFRLYSRGLLEKVPLRGGRFETETEILLRASLLGLAIRTVPVSTIYPPYGVDHHTNFNNLFDTLRVIRVVIRSLGFPRKKR